MAVNATPPSGRPSAGVDCPVVARPTAGWLAHPLVRLPQPFALSEAMVSARGVAQKLREQQDLYPQQELQDLHQALMWAFQESAGQYSKLNCFCDQPTEHLQKLPESHQLTILTYDLIDYSGQREDAGVHTILFKPSQQALGRKPAKKQPDKHPPHHRSPT